MCYGVLYDHEGHSLQSHFSRASAVLPVCTKTGGHVLVPWGRRPDEPGALPVGASARHEDILAGEWDYFFPKPVCLAINAIAEPTKRGKVRWAPVVRSNALQGVVARDGEEQRVYIVTIPVVLPEVAAQQQRCPRFVFRLA